MSSNFGNDIGFKNRLFLDLSFSTGTILFSRTFMATDNAIGTSLKLVFSGEAKAIDLLLFYLLA